MAGYLLAIRRGVAGNPGMETIMPCESGRNELRELAGRGAQLVEVLPADEYEWTHLHWAVNHPLKELDAGAGQQT